MTDSLDLQPTLTGEQVCLRPLKRDDFDALYKAASDPNIWAMHPDSQRYKREIFEQRFFEGAISSGGAFAIEEAATGRVIGSTRYYEWQPEAKAIAIGYTFITCDHWGSGTNREAKALMLNHISPWVKTVWFHVGKDNMRSRKAVEKLGAIEVYEEARELDGRPFVQLYYRLDIRSSISAAD